jgi:hypothetical protein
MSRGECCTLLRYFGRGRGHVSLSPHDECRSVCFLFLFYYYAKIYNEYWGIFGTVEYSLQATKDCM